MAKSALEQLAKMAERFDQETLTKEDFVNNFEKVVDLVLDVQQRQAEAIAKLEQINQNVLKTISDNHDVSVKELKEQVTGLFVERRIKEMTVELTEKMASIRDGRNGKDGETITGPQGERGPQGFAASGKELIEILKTVGVPMALIDGLKEKLQDITRKAATRGGIMAGPNVNAVLVEDLSSQANGQRKEFVVPRHRRAIALMSSQFPWQYRPTVDFTTSNKVLTMTGEVATIESEQTLTFLYVK